VCIFAVSAAVYNRAWEVFASEPTPGAARFSVANPPGIQPSYNGLQVKFPDGRVWCNGIGMKYDWWGIADYLYGYPKYTPYWRWNKRILLGRLGLELFGWRVESLGPQQFLSGSNWVSVTAPYVWPKLLYSSNAPTSATNPSVVLRYSGVAGIQSDGSLWISREIKPAESTVWTGDKMVRWGDETNWQQVVGGGRQILLLKKDGSLWQRYNTNGSAIIKKSTWPVFRHAPLKQIGSDTDWQEILSDRGGSDVFKKKDGSLWIFQNDEVTQRKGMERFASPFPYVYENSSSYSIYGYLGRDGTLWASYKDIRKDYLWNNWHEKEDTGHTDAFLQVTKETNWMTAITVGNRMIALKTDGTLWQWEVYGNGRKPDSHGPPTRLDNRNDWVGLTVSFYSMTTLSADGNVWFWNRSDAKAFFVKMSRRPQLVCNVFDSK